jgi:hypothetical protein
MMKTVGSLKSKGNYHISTVQMDKRVKDKRFISMVVQQKFVLDSTAKKV